MKIPPLCLSRLGERDFSIGEVTLNASHHDPDFSLVSQDEILHRTFASQLMGDTTPSEPMSMSDQTIDTDDQTKPFDELFPPLLPHEHTSTSSLQSDFLFFASRVKWKSSIFSMQICNLCLTIVSLRYKAATNECLPTHELETNSATGNVYMNLLHILILMVIGVFCSRHASTNILRRDTYQTIDASTEMESFLNEPIADASPGSDLNIDENLEIIDPCLDYGSDSMPSPNQINMDRNIDYKMIDLKLQQVRNMLHDSIPFISTNCRITGKSSVDNLNVDRARNSIQYNDGSTTRHFSFDAIYDSNCTQEDIFESFDERITAAFTGMPVVFIAIGTSGSGKTYTFLGSENKSCESDGDLGIVGRTLKKYLTKIVSGDKMSISAWEISINGLTDLLRRGHSSPTETLDHTSVKSNRIKRNEDVFAAITRLRKNRVTATTDLNNHSSRAHTIIRISVKFKNGLSTQLVFADLAGFEPLNSDDMKTSTFINGSL